MSWKKKPKKKPWPLKKMTENLLDARFTVPKQDPRVAMDKLVSDLGGKKYAPKIPEPSRNKVRIVVYELREGCEECLNKKAVIYSTVFNLKVCLDCEEKLTIDAGAMFMERRSKRFKKRRSP